MSDASRYFFVLENRETGEIGGISGIKAKSGVDQPCYFFARDKLRQVPLGEKVVPHLHEEMEVLFPICCVGGPSELCSLYLDKEFRSVGVGKLLSLGRILFVAAFPERFHKLMTAIMRAFFNEEGECPFWNGLGRKFFDVDVGVVRDLLREDQYFIHHIIPRFPLYLSTLSEEVQESIGKVHPNSQKALQMLVEEGFQITNEIDALDGSCKVQAPVKEIRSLKESCVASIAKVVEKEFSSNYLISNERLDFRAVQGALQVDENKDVVVGRDVAEALEVDKGSMVRFVNLR